MTDFESIHPNEKGLLRGEGVYQILAVVDLSVSSHRRALDAAVSSASRRLLKVLLTNGVERSVGIEHRPCGKFDDIIAGTLIRIQPFARRREGVFLLSDEVVEVIGNSSPRVLALTWRAQEERKAKALGRPCVPTTLTAVAAPTNPGHRLFQLSSGECSEVAALICLTGIVSNLAFEGGIFSLLVSIEDGFHRATADLGDQWLSQQLGLSALDWKTCDCSAARLRLEALGASLARMGGVLATLTRSGCGTHLLICRLRPLDISTTNGAIERALPLLAR